MNEVNKKRSEALGMPMGTANSQLRKILLFDCLKRLDEDVCYRCKTKIQSIEELSIEHKQSWLYSDNPKESFFDLNNISFSHLICNISAPKDKVWIESLKGKPSPRKGIPLGLKHPAPVGQSWCSVHKGFLPVSNFHKEATSGSGYKYICKNCRRSYRQERYKEKLSR